MYSKQIIAWVLWCSTFCWLTITHRYYRSKCCQPEGKVGFITLPLWCTQHLRRTASLHCHTGCHEKPAFRRKITSTCSSGSDRPVQHIQLCCSRNPSGQCCHHERGGRSQRGRSFFWGGRWGLNYGTGGGRGGRGGWGVWKQGSGKGVDTRGEDREKRKKKVRAEEDAVRSQGRPQGQLSEW